MVEQQKMLEERLSIWIVTTTVADPSQADSLAVKLVQERVAACVQCEGPITSIYRFEGEFHRDSEFRLLIKTNGASYSALLDFLKANHPYKTPQIVSVRADDADASYAAWVQEQVEN